MISVEGLDGKFFSAGLNELSSAGVWFSVAETARTSFAKRAVASIKGRENSSFFFFFLFFSCFNFFQSLVSTGSFILGRVDRLRDFSKLVARTSFFFFFLTSFI